MKQIISVLTNWFKKNLNLKIGIVSGIITGSIVYYINYKYGYMIALAAFTKQFFYNFFMSGFNAGICERLAKSIQNSWKAILMATLIPTIVAYAGVFSVHYFLNTPKPLQSTLWQAGINLILFFIAGLAYRKDLERRYKWARLIISSKRRIEMRLYESHKSR